jgi:hypothetical protein
VQVSSTTLQQYTTSCVTSQSLVIGGGFLDADQRLRIAGIYPEALVGGRRDVLVVLARTGLLPGRLVLFSICTREI